jgi:ABC-type proline/glycine betaine transport system permease subunit
MDVGWMDVGWMDVRAVMGSPERYEQLIAFLDSQLPQPVDRQTFANGALQFTGGDPAQVVVLLTDSSVVVSEFAGVWETPFNFVAAPRRVGLVKWKRLPETPLMNAISALIKGAREARLSQFQSCQYCGKNTAPEWLRDDHVCQACAVTDLGVVH